VKKLRMAVVGAGRLGGFHAQKIAASRQAELVAVVDPDFAARSRVASASAGRPLADHRQLAGEIDAAVIAAPTRLHHRLGLDLLQWGVHLLVEKPLCRTLDEADELVDVARRKGLILQVGHVERFNPAFLAALPHLGNPKYIEAVRTSGFTFRSTDIGAVLDIMIHDLDLVLSIVRSPLRKVDALGLSVLGGHEDVANARLEFQSGCVATLSASRVSYESVRRMHVWSLDGFAAVDFATRRTTLVRPSHELQSRSFDVNGLSGQEVQYYREHLFEEHLPREEVQSEAVDALALELDDFVQSILTPRMPQVTGRQGREAIAAAEQILTELHSHAWDDRADGPVGPMAVPRPSVIPAPHFGFTPAASLLQRKEAG